MLNVTTSFVTMASEFTALRGFTVRSSSAGFPSFLPKEVDKIKDPFARKLATRIERLSVPVNLPLFFSDFFFFLVSYYWVSHLLLCLYCIIFFSLIICYTSMARSRKDYNMFLVAKNLVKEKKRK